jgi:hypothetical protein
MAVECALKASIIAHQRWNRSPTRKVFPDFYGHDLRKLAIYAGIKIETLVADPVFPSWCTVRLWRRAEGYNPRPMPIAVAGSMVDAACGSDGVIQWLMNRFRLAT